MAPPERFKFPRISAAKTIGWLLCLFFFIGVLFFGIQIFEGPEKWRMIAALPGPLRKAGDYVLKEAVDLSYLLRRFESHDLPVYDLRVSSADLGRLNANLPKFGEALREENRIYVPATLMYNGNQYDVEVRYRGDTSAHWAYPKKSLRIRFDKDTPFDGKRMINLIIPEDRIMLGEEMNSIRARKLGLLTPDSQFVVVAINGVNPVVYWEVEQMREEFLEHHGANPAANLYGDQFLYKPLYTDVAYWQKYSIDPSRHEKDVAELAVLLDLVNRAGDEEFNRRIFNLVDKESLYQWSVWALLAGSSSQGSLHNMKLYFDPSIRKFKIAAWDLSIDQRYSTTPDEAIFEETDNPLLVRVLAHPPFAAERNERLWQAVQNEESIKEDLARYDDLYSNVRAAVYQDRIKEFVNAFFDAEVARVRLFLEERFYRLRSLFTESRFACQMIAGRLLVVSASLAPLSVTAVNGISLPSSISIKPATAHETKLTDYFLSSGGLDPASYQAYRVGTVTTTLALPNVGKATIKNDYTGNEKEMVCTPGT